MDVTNVQQGFRDIRALAHTAFERNLEAMASMFFHHRKDYTRLTEKDNMESLSRILDMVRAMVAQAEILSDTTKRLSKYQTQSTWIASTKVETDT